MVKPTDQEKIAIEKTVTHSSKRGGGLYLATQVALGLVKRQRKPGEMWIRVFIVAYDRSND